MKIKTFKKAFTLVEMLIVVIIIWILIAALMPKFTWAQANTRDVARKANMSTISAAFIQHFDQEWKYPSWTCMSQEAVKKAVSPFISEIPMDPQKSRVTFWTKSDGCKDWHYAYAALKSNGAMSGWAVFIANMENFGKWPNWAINWTNSTISWDVSDLTDKRCIQWVVKTWGDTKVCSETDKRWATKTQNETLFVVFN